MIFDQGIEKSDLFVLAKTGEEGVRFSGPFGSVHYINALKREVHLIGIRLDRLTKFTIFQWFKCIEKRHNPGGCDVRSEEHTSELQSRGHLVCRLLLEKKNEDNKDEIQ